MKIQIFRIAALFVLSVAMNTDQLFGQSSHSTADRGSSPEIVAHRGASADAPENTLPAFKLAWKHNADAIEGDFHLTKDGKIVCIHDKTTKKYCDQNLIVKNSTLAQLRKLDVGKKFHSNFEGTQIPTLLEVLKTVPDGKKILVEIKCGTEIIPQLLNDLAKSGLKQKQIILISFNAEVVKEYKKKRKNGKAYWLSGFKDGKPTAEKILAVLKETNADGFSSSKTGITQEVIRKIQEAGYSYHVWTVDSPTMAKKLRHWGAESITTNKPKLIRETMAR